MYATDNSDPDYCASGGIQYLPFSEISAGNTPSDRRGLGACGPFTFEPGETEELDIAFVFGRDYQSTGAAAGVTVMKQRIDAIREMFRNDSTPCGGKFSSGTNQLTIQKSPFSIYPNPASENIYISFSQELTNSIFKIYDVTGKIMEEGKINYLKQNISLKKYYNGIYLIIISDGEKTVTKKFVKK